MPKRKYAAIEDLLLKEPNLSPTQAAQQLGFKGEFQYRFNKEDGKVKPRKRSTDDTRNDNSKKQTVGVPDFNNTPISQTQKHHLRMLSLYEPLYKGLSNSDAKKLSQHFVDIGMPLGDVQTNRGDLPQPEHSGLHNYMRKNGMTGKHMPDFSKLSLNERKLVAEIFYKDFIQPDIDKKTMSLMQDFQNNDPESYKKVFREFMDTDTARKKNQSEGKPIPERVRLNPLNKVFNRAGERIARSIVPGLGSAMDAQDLRQRWIEFQQNPNLMNGLQLGNQAISAGANGVGDIALSTGLGTPIAAGAEKVALGAAVNDAILQGTEDFFALSK